MGWIEKRIEKRLRTFAGQSFMVGGAGEDEERDIDGIARRERRPFRCASADGTCVRR